MVSIHDVPMGVEASRFSALVIMFIRIVPLTGNWSFP